MLRRELFGVMVTVPILVLGFLPGEKRWVLTGVDSRDQLVRRERLAQTDCCTDTGRQAQKIQARIDRIAESEAGHREDRQHRRSPPKFRDSLKTIHPGHKEIDDHQVKSRRFKRSDSGISIGRMHRVAALANQRHLNCCANGSVVVNDENPHNGWIGDQRSQANVPILKTKPLIVIAAGAHHPHAGWQ
jgi:hypothetical protein